MNTRRARPRHGCRRVRHVRVSRQQRLHPGGGDLRAAGRSHPVHVRRHLRRTVHRDHAARHGRDGRALAPRPAEQPAAEQREREHGTPEHATTPTSPSSRWSTRVRSRCRAGASRSVHTSSPRTAPRSSASSPSTRPRRPRSPRRTCSRPLRGWRRSGSPRTCGCAASTRTRANSRRGVPGGRGRLQRLPRVLRDVRLRSSDDRRRTPRGVPAELRPVARVHGVPVGQVG